MRTRHVLASLVAGLVAVMSVGLGIAAFGADDTRGEVVRVIDGDTLLALVDGDEITIRLLNVDTPETKDPDEPVQCLGPEATEFLTQRLPAGTEIALEYDEERTDRYDRTLAGVYESDSLINAEIAAEGLGAPVLFEPNDKFLPPVEEAYADAQEQGLGLFADNLECTLPGQLQALSSAVDEVPQSVDGDPASALVAAETAVEEADVFLGALTPEGLPGLGNEVLAGALVATYLDGLRDEADKVRDRAEGRRFTLDEAKTEYDEEQERLEEERREREEQERREREKREAREAEEREREEQAERDRKAEEEREAKRSESSSTGSDGSSSSGNSSSGRSSGSGASGNSGSSGGSSSGSSSGGSGGSSSGSGGNSGGSSGSGCTPYGPEVSYANDGGYTGKRYGMPGGKTFRKCH